MFTRARPDANRADPEMARLVGIRLLFAEEPDDGARWNGELLKDWSGGGKLVFRLNFGNDIHIAPAQFMMHFACNDVIAMNGSDGGVRNRMNKIDYRSRFVDGDSLVDSAALRYKKDIGIEERFSGWAPDLMRMLLQRYKHGYVPPVPNSVERAQPRI